MNRYALAGTIAAATTLADHLTKLWAIDRLKPPGRPIVVIPGYFDLIYAQNTGSAFGLFRGWGPALTVVGLGALVFVAWLLHRHPHARKRSVAALGLILGGAIGNVSERVVRGYVVDFIDWHVGDAHWPAFNVADAALVVGVIMILIWPEKVPAAPDRTG